MHAIHSWAVALLSLILVGGAAQAAPTAFVPLGSANRVIGIDVATGRITRTFTGVVNPHGLVATPDGEYLIAGSLSESALPPGSADGTPNSKLFVIHPLHGHVMSEIPVAGWTHHQAITPDGRYVISTHPTRGGVSILDLRESKVVHTIRTGTAPNYAVVSRNGTRAFISNTGDSSISELDLATAKVVRTLEAGSSPEHMVSSPDEAYLFAANTQTGTVSRVSVATGKVVRDYSIGMQAHGLDIGDDGKTLFATSRADKRLVAVDIETGKQRRLTLAPDPYHLNTIPGTGKIYVSSASAPIIWVVDQRTLKVSTKIDLPAGEGHQIAVIR